MRKSSDPSLAEKLLGCVVGGACFEPETVRSGYRWGFDLSFYEEVRDSGANFFIEELTSGVYTLRHRLRLNMAGSFRVGPATLQSMCAPEFAAYSTSARFDVRGQRNELGGC